MFKAIEYAVANELFRSNVAHTICDLYYDLRIRQYDGKVEPEKVRYLTQQQLREFKELQPFMPHSRTREFMDLFLFSFHACGLRFSDMLTLEWKHIDCQKHCLRKNLYKEKKPHTVPLNDDAMDILEHWELKHYNNRFVFNLLSEEFNLNNQLALDNKRKSKNRALQTSLHKIGRKLPTKLEFSLSIHVARHTFVVMALNSGMSIYALSKVLGHRSVAATEKFYAQYLYPNLAEEVTLKLTNNFSYRVLK